MKIDMKAEVPLPKNMRDIRKLETIPDEAKVTVRHLKYMDQRDPGGDWLVFNWTEER